MVIAKEEAKKLIDRLPDQATWDDIMYHKYVQKDGKVLSHKEEKMRISE
jgi:hypothetical protein